MGRWRGMMVEWCMLGVSNRVEEEGREVVGCMSWAQRLR